MHFENSPNPEALLEVIKTEESRKNKGKLKLFLGMAAGVGKTYAMLEEAHSLKSEDVDVVVGIVDDHGRTDTKKLLHGLEILPTKSVLYKEKEFPELDVDAVIALHPVVVLVDELAHNNAPGSKHAKRWQDVMEILDAGINVYSTLDVQHIESLNDIVSGITEVSIRETVPDQVIDQATSIQLVDITPDQLIERLHEGKVYLADQSQLAIEHFFQKDRLTALREILLRYGADKVAYDLRHMMANPAGGIKWKAREKFLVAVSQSPHSQKLIRTARRFAANVDAPWIAVHVDTGVTLSDQDFNQLTKNLALARDLGAEVITLKDPDAAEGIKRAAIQYGVTQMIVGRPPSNPFSAYFSGYTLLDRLAAECKDIDIHVIRQDSYTGSYRKKLFKFSWTENISDYLTVFFITSLFTAFSVLIEPLSGYKVIGALYLLGILFLSAAFSLGPLIFGVFLLMLEWNFFFIPPLGFTIDSFEDLAILLIYSLMGISMGVLLHRTRLQNQMLAKNEKTTFALYEIMRILAGSQSVEEKLHFLKRRLPKIVEGGYLFLVKGLDDGLIFDDPEKFLMDKKEKNAAIWSFENGKESGWSTDTLPSAQNLYIPLKGYHEVTGLLVFRPKPFKSLSIEEKNFLYTVCQELSNSLEQTFSEARTQQNDRLLQIEKIHRMLLERFSRAFESPMLAMRTAIQHISAHTDRKVSAEDVRNLESSYEVFSKFLGNIFAMVQLSEGMVPVKESQLQIGPIIKECCEREKDAFKDYRIVYQIHDNLPQVSVDPYLIQILIHNLILNAIEHSPKDSTILVEVKTAEGNLVIQVSDEGNWIPEDQLALIFEKFYRLPKGSSQNVGVGLSIAKTIAELHHGQLKAENLPLKGARFSVLIPLT